MLDGLSIRVQDLSSDKHSIVFIHGLQGHPEKTWTYIPPSTSGKLSLSLGKKPLPQETPSGVFWPLDLLSKRPRLTKARILTWGYESNVINFLGSPNHQNMTRHGNDLMVALEQERKEHVRLFCLIMFCFSHEIFSFMNTRSWVHT
jgi:hypothetical protein